MILLIKTCLFSIETAVVYIVKLLVNMLDSIALFLAMSLSRQTYNHTLA